MSYRGPGVPIGRLKLRPGAEFRTINALPVPFSLVPREALGADGEPSDEEIRAAQRDARLSREVELPVPVMRAIRQVESGGRPNAIRFETRVFRNRAGQTVEGSNREAFERAYAINPQAAVESTSWGWFQVMGFHGFPQIYGGPQQAVRAFDANPEEVGTRLFKVFMDRHPVVKRAARTRNWGSLAANYNGCDDCTRYVSRFTAAYEDAVRDWERLAPYVGQTPSSTPSWAFWAAGVAGVAAVLGGVSYAILRRR